MITQNKTKKLMAAITVAVLSIVGFGVLNVVHMGNVDAQVSTASSPPSLSLGKPPFNILLNGSSVYPSYTVTRGQNLVIFVDIESNQTYPVSLVARHQIADGTLPTGMTMDLPVSITTTPITHIPMHIHVPTNITPGVYPMAVDAIHTSGDAHMTFQAGFNLLVGG
ncbi:MAG: hypothetical protein ACYC6W_01400 [Nitrosotalea sp.]